MKKWLDKLCGKIWWKKLGGKIAWKSLVEEFFWKNLVVISCGKIGWKPCFKCFVFFMRQIGRNSLVEKSMDKMYWKDQVEIVEKVGQKIGSKNPIDILCGKLCGKLDGKVGWKTLVQKLGNNEVQKLGGLGLQCTVIQYSSVC